VKKLKTTTTKRNQTTPQSTITITKEDDFVSYYLKIDDLFFRFFLPKKENVEI